MDNNRRITSVLLILGLVFTVMGGTIAYYNWQTTEEQKTLVSFTVSNDFSLNRKVLLLRTKEKVVSDIFLTRLNKG